MTIRRGPVLAGARAGETGADAAQRGVHATLIAVASTACARPTWKRWATWGSFGRSMSKTSPVSSMEAMKVECDGMSSIFGRKDWWSKKRCSARTKRLAKWLR